MQNKRNIYDGRLRIVGMGNDPTTIQSYGLLLNNLTKMTSKAIQWHILVNEYPFGSAQAYPHYVKWCAGRTTFDRNVTHLKDCCDFVKPNLIFSVGDIQDFTTTKSCIPTNTPWIHWLPIDHEDLHRLLSVQRIMNSMDVVVPMSKFAFNFCEANNIKTSNYIYPFVDTNTYKPITDDKQKKVISEFLERNKATNKQVLLFVGRPGWRKNMEFLFGILKRLLVERGRKDLLLFCQSDINDPSKEFNIQKLLYAMGIPEDSIRFPKNFRWYKGDPEYILNALYNMSDIYISPHEGEGFGIPIAESMSCEKPFVATNCTTTPEFSGNGKRGLGAKVKISQIDRTVVRPWVDIEDFCDKVEYLLDHDNIREKMGKAGRRWVRRNCDYPIITQKWTNLFESLNTNRVVIKKVVK